MYAWNNILLMMFTPFNWDWLIMIGVSLLIPLVGGRDDYVGRLAERRPA